MSAMQIEVFEAFRAIDVPEDKAVRAAAALTAAMSKAEQDIAGAFVRRDADIEAMRKDLGAVRAVMATKADLDALRAVMATKADLDALRAVMATKIDLDAVNRDVNSLKGAISSVKGDVTALKLDLTAVKGDVALLKWMVGFLLASSFTALFKLFSH